MYEALQRRSEAGPCQLQLGVRSRLRVCEQAQLPKIGVRCKRWKDSCAKEWRHQRIYEANMLGSARRKDQPFGSKVLQNVRELRSIYGGGMKDAPLKIYFGYSLGSGEQ